MPISPTPITATAIEQNHLALENAGARALTSWTGYVRYRTD